MSEMSPDEIIRFWMLGAHYRQPIDFTEDGLKQAKAQLDRFYGALERAGDTPASDPDDAIIAALCDDVNSPAAIAALHEILGELNRVKFADKPAIAGRLKASAALMGILQQDPQGWLKGDDAGDDDRIEDLVAERIAARQSRNFQRADEIRDQLKAEGILLEDGPGGTTWRRA